MTSVRTTVPGLLDRAAERLPIIATWSKENIIIFNAPDGQFRKIKHLE